MSNDSRAGRAPLAQRREDGQALVEAVVVLAVMGALFAGTASIGIRQFHILQAGSDSRLLAFSRARGEPAPRHSVSGWGDVRVGRSPVRFFQVGGQAGEVGALRRDWKAEDGGMVVAAVGNTALSLLEGAGHADSDRAAAARVAASATGWGAAADRASSAGRTVAARVGGIDDGWRRARPRFDWLDPWRDLIPERALADEPPLPASHDAATSDRIIFPLGKERP